MKRLLTAIAFLVCLGAKAQTIPVHLDSAAQMWYANIDTLYTPTFPGTESVPLTQVRISFNGSVPGLYAYLRIGFYYQEAGTGRYLEYIGYNRQVNMPPGPINPVQLAFTYVRDTFSNIVYTP